jgi:hypothetical protein
MVSLLREPFFRPALGGLGTPRWNGIRYFYVIFDLRAIGVEPRLGTHFVIFSSRKKTLRHRHSPDVATAHQEGREAVAGR